MKKDKQVVIIGAGISGLVCAIELEQAGFHPVIIEKASRAGGRVKTDRVNGFILDHGFQVLLTAYPAAQKYLDLEALDLKRFLPGAVIMKDGKPHKFGDPLRASTFLLPAVFSSIGSLKDKMIVHRLANRLKKANLEAIFGREETTTLSYLEEQGFSDRIISQFLRPFFAGIFLDTELRTSSRMFEFVYKMFATGYAAVPRKGMEAIPGQLAGRLKQTNWKFNTNVKQIDGQKIYLEGGESIHADQIIMATDPSRFFHSVNSDGVSWKSCQTLYFRAPESILGKPIIGLIPDRSSLVNHFHYVSDLLGADGGHLLSATVVRDHELDQKHLIRQVEEDLAKHANINSLEFIKLFDLPRSLPDIRNLCYAPKPERMRLTDSAITCGDFLANGSLNAAMESGRIAAEMIIGRS